MEEIKKLLEKKEFGEAIKQTNSIIDDFWKANVLREILSELLTMNNYSEYHKDTLIDEIIEVIMRMNKNRYRTLKDVSIILVKAQLFEKAIEIANLISRTEYKVEALKIISDKLISSKNVDINKNNLFSRLIFIATKIRIKEFKMKALKHLVEKQIEEHNFNEAIKLTEKMDDRKTKELSLSDIACGLANIENYTKALEVAKLVRKAERKVFILHNISVNMSKSREFEMAIETTNLIKDDFWKSDALMHISIELTNNNNFEKAHEIAESIDDNLKKKRAYKHITKKRLYNND